jgi:alcohol dehydrogenase class IV
MLHQILVTIRKPFIKMVPVPTPEKIRGESSLEKLGSLCEQLNMTHPLVVTDPTLCRLGLLNKVTAQLDSHQIAYAVFDQVTPDPDFKLVRKGVEHFTSHHCDGVIALGGGSPMDCAKAISACAKTGKDITRLLGLLKVRRRPFPVIAIPTTAGTGSEATVAAVISDPVSRTKPNITDPFIVPKVAVLAPNLMVDLPPAITAQTGIDALTHAIEAYLSGYSNAATRALCVTAIRRIFDALPIAYQDGHNLSARASLSEASFDAGCAFTRNYIGYVHAIAHQLGAFYHVPHGLANAVVLPRVLHFTLQKNQDSISRLSKDIWGEESGTSAEQAYSFVGYVERFLLKLDIPTSIPELLVDDIPALAKQAMAEAFGQYPVPAVMTRQECEAILYQLHKPRALNQS